MSTTIDPTKLPEVLSAASTSKLPQRPSAKGRFGARRRGGWFGVAWKVGLAAAILGGGAWALTHWFLTNTAQTVEITGTVTRANLPIIVTEKGDLESSKTVDVRCEVEGYQNKIVTILPEGARVTKDQVVVTFDMDQLKHNLEDEKVKLAQAEGKAKAAKSELEVQTNKAGGDIDKADTASKLADLDVSKYIEGDYKVALEGGQADIELAKKETQEAKDQLDNYQKLYRQGFGTLEQLRAKEYQLRQKELALKKAESNLMLLEKFTKVKSDTEFRAKARDARRELDRARKTGEAAIDKAKSEYDAAVVGATLEKQTLERIQKQLDHCIVKAPQDGILVYSKMYYWDNTNRIGPGGTVHFQQPLFSLPDLTQMQVKVKVHESMIKKVKVGQKAEIRVDPYPDRVLHGTVTSVATLADSMRPWSEEGGVKEYICLVKIDDLPLEAELKPGMTAEVKIHAKEIPDVLLVPVQAVAQSEGQHIAYVIGPRGPVERRDVEVGENNEKFVQIVSGLSEGERVALDARARAAAEAKARENTIELVPKSSGSKRAEAKTDEKASATDTKAAPAGTAPATAVPPAPAGQAGQVEIKLAPASAQPADSKATPGSTKTADSKPAPAPARAADAKTSPAPAKSTESVPSTEPKSSAPATKSK
jgi:RND family efflux transporter MFP subunit